jgi:prolycopene isomerase
MKLYKDTTLRERYDVIVVGAGLGGMTAASLLAKRGLSVLMIDQQNKPGGSCTSFKREGVVFDVGTAMIYGFGEKGFKPFRFIMNELEEPIEVIAHPTLTRMTLEGEEIVFWPDIDHFLEELYRLFPDEKEGLRSFYTDLYKSYENIVLKNEVIVPPSEFSPRQGLRRLMSGPLQMIQMQKLLTTSVKDLLDKYFHTKPVIDFFDKLCSAYCYCTAAETPAVLAATMFLDNHIGGVYYPAGGAQMLPNKIEKAFERYGGQTLYRHYVDEIIIRDEKACAVRLEDGTEIPAERVIADATVWNIYGKLVRPEHIKPERLEWARSLVPTYPSMTLYLVVDKQAVPPKAIPWEIFIENRAVIDSTDLTLYINSLVDLSLSPNMNELVIMAIAPNLCQWPASDDPKYHSEEYQTLKKREAERMLDQIESHYPGFRKHIRTLIVGSPTTIERYLLKNGGAVGGPKNAIGQEMLKRLHARSEWKNLFICGDSTVMATGAPATAVSGVGAANLVLRDLHLPEYDSRPFPEQFIHFVNLPYSRPILNPGEKITSANAWLAAAECQWCEEPDCVQGCPAGIDIPGFLRRMEAGNYEGAARLIREQNPLGEVCGWDCDAGHQCQQNCIRKSFSGKAVRIADLQRWVCQTADEAGWPKFDLFVTDKKVAILGSGPAAICCAYYLALQGILVEIFEQETRPGGSILKSIQNSKTPAPAWGSDWKGIQSSGIHFHGNRRLGTDLNLENLIKSYDAIYLPLREMQADSNDHLGQVLGEIWQNQLSAEKSQLASHPKVFASQTTKGKETIVAGAALGRRTAKEIFTWLNHQ